MMDSGKVRISLAMQTYDKTLFAKLLPVSDTELTFVMQINYRNVTNSSSSAI